MSGRTYDLAIIGGGINGCGIARDATGRGLSVYLCEQGDLGGATSSASTKLIHGGLRYLEFFRFGLVREALIEREVLLRSAPHIVRPLRFVLPYHAGLRPRWLLRLGLFLYDHMGGRRLLPPTRTIDLRHHPAGEALKAEFRFGFEYSDCWVDDSRLVILNAVDAAARGAGIFPKTQCVAAERGAAHWLLTMQDAESGAQSTVKARCVINAAGPWAGDVLHRIMGIDPPASIRLVKGSHIVTRKLFEGDAAYIFQNADGRIVFAIPFEDDYTLIGTTDLDFDGDPASIEIRDDEIAYLLEVAGGYLRNPVGREDIVWTYSGVRPLYDDGATSAQAATREYVLALDAPRGMAPTLSIFGGKITTYRRLAEQALGQLAPFLPSGQPWTASQPLPGGEFASNGFADLLGELAAAYPFLTGSELRRLARAYGTRTKRVLGVAKSREELGMQFGSGLSEMEVTYLVEEEWARTAEDVLWRRSKLGLRVSSEERAALEDLLAQRRAGAHQKATQGEQT